ncbi:MAG: 1,4-dihydroxy-2-naphthoate polyprenyltransferase [Candidatus Sericytochromatia bacterium]
MSSIKNWVSAFRLRTLPLALSSIGLGSFLAASQGLFNLRITSLCILTTIFLQILSNLANDYGDSIHGADSIDREGPTRAVQTGNISKEQMKKGIILFTILSIISGLYLIHDQNLLLFIPLGFLSIIAAITYTVGKKPYGYAGLGDISVFIFFGLVGVLGSYFLQAHNFNWTLLLPAFSCGFFSTGVLNINNIRDINSDKLAGKNSIPVRLGGEKARVYHIILLFLGISSSVLYTLLNNKSVWQWLFLVSIPLFIINAKNVYNKKTAQEVDPYLKQMAISTLIFVLTFGIGNIL